MVNCFCQILLGSLIVRAIWFSLHRSRASNVADSARPYHTLHVFHAFCSCVRVCVCVRVFELGWITAFASVRSSLPYSSTYSRRSCLVVHVWLIPRFWPLTSRVQFKHRLVFHHKTVSLYTWAHWFIPLVSGLITSLLVIVALHSSRRLNRHGDAAKIGQHQSAFDCLFSPFLSRPHNCVCVYSAVDHKEYSRLSVFLTVFSKAWCIELILNSAVDHNAHHLQIASRSNQQSRHNMCLSDNVLISFVSDGRISLRDYVINTMPIIIQSTTHGLVNRSHWPIAIPLISYNSTIMTCVCIHEQIVSHVTFPIYNCLPFRPS